MNMKLDKKAKSVIAVYAIILVVYVLAFLIIPFGKIAASWISFVFTMIAIVSSLFICGYAFNAKETLVSKVYGYPIFRIGMVYMLTQLVVGIVISILGAFLAIPYWVALLTSVVLLAATVIGVIVTDNTRDVIEEMDECVKADTQAITYFQVNLAGIVDICENAVIKTELEKLNEQFRFSDPVSSNKTAEIEDKIYAMLTELKTLVEKNSVDDAKGLINKIANTLCERNRICKISK